MSTNPSASNASDAGPSDAGRSDWRRILAVFWVTSLVEGLGVAQIFAFMPAYLGTMGLPEADRLRFVGLFGALIFVVGMPLVPLWGVWADKYSRKAVIIRSALVEAVVFAAVALSREPWQLALSLLLVGFQLGNTGVMLGAIRDTVPRARIGTVLAIFGAASPIGFAIGPIIGGIMVDRLGFGLPEVFVLSGLLSLGTAALIGLGSEEVRPEVVPRGPTLEVAYGALRGVFGDPATRRIFGIFFVSFLANQMMRPYMPILVAQVNGPVQQLSAIGLVVGAAALIGALLAPIGGLIGDRIGHRWVLVGSLFGSGAAAALLPFAPNVPALAVVAIAVGALYATVSPMVFALLGTEVPAARRSQTLNLVYLPLYFGGIVGPILASAVVGFGVGVPFGVAAVVFVAGGVVVGVQARRAPAG
jgi:MFS family permease